MILSGKTLLKISQRVVSWKRWKAASTGHQHGVPLWHVAATSIMHHRLHALS